MSQEELQRVAVIASCVKGDLAWLARSAITADSPQLLRRKNAMIWVFSKKPRE